MKNIDSFTHVRGESIYLDDILTATGTLYLLPYDSPKAHGKILGLDLQAAQNLEGVVRILTHDDIPGENQIGGIFPDEPLLAEDEVHFCGQPIALIIAESELIARKARRLIEVEIEEKEVIVDPREARAKDLLVFPPRTFSLGDTADAWEQCDYIYEGTADSNGQEHLYIETQGAYTQLMENGSLKIASSTQGPTAVQKIVARVLGIAMHKIEVDVVRLGGGFGGKEDQATAYAVMTALAASILKRPIKCALHRMDDMRMTGKRHPYSSDYKIGLTKGLKILAYEATFHQNAGAAADLSPAIMERTLFHATNAYNVPNVEVTAYSCRTNLPPNTAFRGFGGPQGMFVIESAIAKAAAELKISSREIQELNLLDNGDEFPYGQVVDQAQAIKSWKRAMDKYDIKSMEEHVMVYNIENKLSKKGLAIMPICFGISFTNTPMNHARALVHIYQDGSVGVSTGAVEMGQGVNTKMVQVAQSTFGISASKIKLETTNTTRVANTSPTAASAGADLNGKALQNACDSLMERLTLSAAEILACESSDVTIEDNAVWVTGIKSAINWEDLIMRTFLKRINLSEKGHYATPLIHFDKEKEKGHPFAYHVYGTSILEVTVDCLRGTYEFDAVKLIHDCGKSMLNTRT